MKKNKLFQLFGLLLMSASIVSATTVKKLNQKVDATYQVTQDINSYYESINQNEYGNALLSELRTLNSLKRRSTVGYNSMGTSSAGQFKYTDYDPNTVQYDSNNQPYGTKITSFYSGKSITSFNREHVWPDSHGGNKVENDIHMPRPTLQTENGSRGNSFYVEGMKDQQYGWDPATESFGLESYRGDSARIVFYCVVANSNLSLIDESYHETSRKNNDNLMGKLSDLLKWNLKYPVEQREINRNNGAEYLQGNRNPFIDHPEYACKIWGSTNSETAKICQSSLKELEGINVNKENVELVFEQTFQLEVSPIPSDTYLNVKYTSSNPLVADVSSNGLITAKNIVGTTTITIASINNSNIFKTVNVTVKEPSPINLETVSCKDVTTYVNSEIKLNPSISPNNAYPKPSFTFISKDENIASVDGSGIVKGIKEGSTQIKIIAKQNNIEKECLVKITVEPYKEITDTLKNDLFNGYGSDVEYKTSNGLILCATNVGNYSNSIQFKKSTGVLYNKEPINLKNITINGTTSLSVYGSDSKNDQNNLISLTNGTYNLEGYKYFTIANKTSGVLKPTSISITYSLSTINEEELSLNASSLTLKEGETYQLKATPINDVNWSSSNNQIASVNNGLVTAIKEGTATIFAKNNGSTARCEVNVIKNDTPIEKILTNLSYEGNLNKNEYNEGENINLEGLTIYANYSNGDKEDITNKVIYSNSPLTKDDDKIVLSYTYNGITKTLEFSIKVNYINIEINEIILKVNETYQINLNSSNNSLIEYKSLNEEIVSINENGLIKALKEGETSIVIKLNSIEKNIAIKVEAETDTPSKGCQGSIYATSGILSFVSIIGLVLIIKRKKIAK